MRLRQLLTVTLLLGFAECFPAFGQFFPISSPTATYTGSTIVIPITAANGTSMTSLTDGAQTITLSTAFSAQTVPSGGWATWGAPPNTESSTPRVLAVFSPLTSATLTLSAPSLTFGFEVEPDNFGTFTVSATFFNGSTALGTVTRNVTGNAGALLAAGSSTTPITSVVLSAPAAAQGFAMAQFRYGNVVIGTPTPVPTLGTSALGGLSMLLIAAGSLLARAQNARRV